MTTYRVWAPYASDSVTLVRGEGERAERVPMTAQEGGWWSVEVAGEPSARYGYAIDGADPRPDPRGPRLPDGVHGLSAPYDLGEYAWQDGDWVGRPLAGAIVYELHVGTFTPEGTFDAAAARLGHLVELGVTMVELMPVSPFPGVAGWGYDGVAPFAVHEPYGGPAGLQRFVDAAHRHGLAVALDVVHNHLGPDGNYSGVFGPYFAGAHQTPWGSPLNLDGPDSDEVRRYVIDSVVMWLRDYHLDALRLDAVHALYDERATPILEEMSAAVDALAAELGRALWLIAEDDRNDPRTIAPRGTGDATGGAGIHAQWTDDIHHALHVALTGETQGYYADFADPGALPKVYAGAFFHDGTWSSFRQRSHGRRVDRAGVPGWRFVASLQTHDQVGNRRLGERLSMLVSAGRCAAGAALLLTSPFTPMLFMGEEWAAGTPWQYFTDHVDPALAEAIQQGRIREFAAHGWGPDEVPDPQSAATVAASRLDWSELDRPDHRRMYEWYRKLIGLRAAEPELSDPRLDRVSLEWDALRRVGVLQRGTWRTVVNLGPQPAVIPLVGDASGGAGSSEELAYRPRIEADWSGEASLAGATLTLPGESACLVSGLPAS